MHTPAARDPQPGQTRKRPYIYVYELPGKFNSHLLQYRFDKLMCVYRYHNENNDTLFNTNWAYGIETALHELLLQSEHRTLDPDEADYFYLPVYTSCYIYPIWGAEGGLRPAPRQAQQQRSSHLPARPAVALAAKPLAPPPPPLAACGADSNDSPWWPPGGPVTLRTQSAALILVDVHSYIRAHFPYWDRHGGADHIVLVSHDEANCWVPSVLRSAIVMGHWGRTDLDHISQTNYLPDNYTWEFK